MTSPTTAKLNAAYDQLNFWYDKAKKLDEELAKAEERIAELESRTVTIELPLPSCTYADHSYPAYSKRQIVNILAAAGIQVIEGEGQ